MNIKTNILKVIYTKSNKFKHLKTFEDLDEFNLDDNVEHNSTEQTSNSSQEEEEKIPNNSIEEKLNSCINDCQQFINMYTSEKYKDILKIAESAVEFSQICLNTIKRNYGPVDDVKNVTKKMLEQCATDFKNNSNIEMSMQCADKCSNASNSL